MDAVSRLRGERSCYEFCCRLSIIIHDNYSEGLWLVAGISRPISQRDSAEDIDRVRYDLIHIETWSHQPLGKFVRVLILRFERGAIQIYTIERRLPIGICGSGILDAIAALLDAGVLESRGNFRKGAEHVRQNTGGDEYLLVSAENSGSGGEIVLTRQDISEIQFAKAAIRAGIEVLLEAAGVGAAALEEFIIAGAFGSYLDVGSALRIGLFPQIPLGKFRQVGNAAGIGARHMLISGSQRRLGEALAKQVEYVELAGHPHFQDKFAQNLFF